MAALHVVSAANLAVNVLELVATEYVRSSERHLTLVEKDCKHAVLLRFVELVVVPRELRPRILALVDALRLSYLVAREQAVVAECVVLYLSLPAVDVEECALFANELVASDIVAFHCQGRILQVAVELQDTRLVPQSLVGDYLHV